MSTRIQPKVVDRLPGDTYADVEAAAAVLGRLGGDVSRYAVTVVDDRGRVTIFRAAHAADAASADARGTVAVRSGANAALTPEEWQGVQSRTGRQEPLARFAGSNFPPVHAAMPAFLSHLPSVTPYVLTVLRSDASVVVLFTDKDADPRARGSTGAHPGFTVELDPHDLRVARWYFVR